MKRFDCTCGQELFFENSACLRCGQDVGFEPERLEMLRADDAEATGLARCVNWTRHGVCNWWSGADHELCRACRRNVVIPNLDAVENHGRWRVLELAKRRLLYSLITLDLDFEAPERPLCFFFLEDQRTNADVAEEMVYTGYSGGRITVLAAEADDLFRESQRASMDQRYRTVLGHLRHESGHYFWERLVSGSSLLDRYRELFGDETTDYQAALDRFYAEPPQPSPEYVSLYARSHPLEDWAETWSHALHVHDVVETARARKLVPAAEEPSGLLVTERQLDTFADVAVSLNELNRSLGLADAYPFTLTERVREKLLFIESAVSAAARPR